MKKITWLSIIAATLLGMLLLCCKNDLSGEATVKGEGITTGDTLNISITTDENLQIFQIDEQENVSRTITSEAFKIGDSGVGDSLFFYLYGHAQSGQELLPKLVSVSSEDGITGEVIIDIDCYNWELTLVACETDGLTTESDILSDAVLIGYANVDMMFTNEIKFTLSPKGLTKKGDIKLQIALQDDWPIPEGYVATAGIYDLETGNAVTGFSGATGDIDLSEELYNQSVSPEVNSFNPVASFTTDSYTANGASIAPGSYLFQINFTKENENRKYVWNDTVIILPGKTTTSITGADGNLTTQIIIPNLIGEKPVAPSDFRVTYNEDENQDANGFYSAEFTWDGSAVDTEMNFALDLMLLTDEQTTPASLVASDTEWETLVDNNNKVLTFDYLNDVRKDLRYYKAGSLFANKSSLTLYLELGKRYIARLYSENNAGKSVTAAYVTINDDSNGNKYTVINRYQVTYHIQGGTWETGATSKVFLDQVNYWGQSDNSYTVINPVGETDAGTGKKVGTTANPYLYSGAADWLYWAEGLGGEKYDYDSSTPNVYPPNPYAGYKNLDLYASYSRIGNVEVYDDNNYDILASYVSGFGVAESELKKNETNIFSKANGTPIVEGGTELKTEVSIKLPEPSEETDPTWVYDRVIFEISYGGRTYLAEEQVGAARGTANTFTIPLKNLPSGYVYNCKLTAHYQRTVISYPFTVSLKD